MLGRLIVAGLMLIASGLWFSLRNKTVGIAFLLSAAAYIVAAISP